MHMNPVKLSVAASLLTLLTACAAQAPRTVYVREEVQHPAYIHALSDLRAARWLIEHRPGDARVDADENVALTEIQTSIKEIRQAAIDDGKDLDDKPPVDAHLDRKGRLHKAAELLHKVHADVAREEDDPVARDLQRRIVRHVDEATRATEHAIHDAERAL
ncbi:MAG: hypothetical protein JWN23_2543 [Rhodocyclales bacterium]|nr:hypothetical protein [Rhodocyclales bacterium]